MRWGEDGEGAAAPLQPLGSARDVPPAPSFQDTICQHRPVGWEGEERESRGGGATGRSGGGTPALPSSLLISHLGPRSSPPCDACPFLLLLLQPDRARGV